MTYSFLNFNGGSWISNFTPHFIYWTCDYLSMPWLKLIHVSKRGPTGLYYKSTSCKHMVLNKKTYIWIRSQELRAKYGSVIYQDVAIYYLSKSNGFWQYVQFVQVYFFTSRIMKCKLIKQTVSLGTCNFEQIRHPKYWFFFQIHDRKYIPRVMSLWG